MSFFFLSKILFIINCNYNTIFICNVESVCTVFCQFIIIYFYFSPTKISDFLSYAPLTQQLPDPEVWNEHWPWPQNTFVGFVQIYRYISMTFLYTYNTDRIAQPNSLTIGTFFICRGSSKWEVQHSIQKSLRLVLVDFLFVMAVMNF